MVNNNSPLRIAVDAHRLLCEPQTSGATYLSALVRQWGQAECGVALDLLLPFEPGPEMARLRLLVNSRVRLLVAQRPVNPVARYRNQFFWQQFVIPGLLRRICPDVYFSPFHLTPQLPWDGKVITTIHDLCFLAEPCCAPGAWIHRLQVKSACIRATRLICVSRFTLNQLAAWSPGAARKAEVVHNGIESQRLPLPEARARLAALGADLVPGKYLIWIGNPSARKNPGLLVDIFRLFQQLRPETKLVVAAPAESHNHLRLLARERGVLPSLRLFAGVDDSARDALYRCAWALVFPSRCEGFGYPVLEAIGQGCPAFSLAASPMSEIIGGLLPGAEAATPQAFLEVLNQYGTLSDAGREEMGQRLATRAGTFSAQAMAAGTLQAIKRAAAGG